MTAKPAVDALVALPMSDPREPPHDWPRNGDGPATREQRMQRSSGQIAVSFKADGSATRLDRCYQAGCAKLRLPRQHGGMDPTGVLINTAGGLTGGDSFQISATLADHAAATLTSQAAEKIYRSAGGCATIENQFTLGKGARLDWLPQETILFDHGAMSRRSVVQMAGDSSLTATELIMFGRTAMGETVDRGHLRDSWRIIRDGRLIFADSTRLAGRLNERLVHPAVASGDPALALILHVAPDGARHLEAVRGLLETTRGMRGGASAYDGVLVARMISPEGAMLRTLVLAVMAVLRDGPPPPRTWLI